MGCEGTEPLSSRGTALPLAARLGFLGIALAAFDVGAATIKNPIARAGVTVGDLIEGLAPFVLIPLYAAVGLALRSPGPGARPDPPPDFRGGFRILLAVGAIVLVFGHGVHVAANSIHDMLERAGLPDPKGLAFWWDERVSHYLIDAAKIALCAGLTALERVSPAPATGTAGRERPLHRVIFAVGALAYGFIYFADGIEGQTAPLVLPFAVAYLLWAILRGRSAPRRSGEAHGLPGSIVRRFFAAAALTSLALFTIWGVWHRGFPEFTAVGLLP